ncbi:MAG: Gfo/Idh/MocA family oxidoreductase [Bacteroidaceae bacterium]|nr:Gfo/Idh/MocA family oxidoreductase [Bacteroidaceae bacterium]
MNIGIIGAGHIAAKLTYTLSRMEGVCKYAIASRDLAKAQVFAHQHGFQKAYGSYEELVNDADVELVYIATPHSHHFAHASLALKAGKAVLCEKAFTANAHEATELIRLSREKGAFLAEAIWTRYMPFSKTIREVIDSGVIGTPQTLTASLSYPIGWKERIQRADLCGGALLDLGVYCINFARMCLGTDIERVESSCVKGGEEGMDMHETISLVYRDGRMATLTASALCIDDHRGIICGDKGYIVIDNVNNPTTMTVFLDYKPVAEYRCPERITGYEYEVLACKEGIEKHWVESPDMPHAEILAIMEMMDELRNQWGVKYPNDNEIIR